MTVYRIGVRVAWADEEPPAWDGIGTVVAPTWREQLYMLRWRPEDREAVRGHVLVAWDGGNPWDRAWVDPADLRVLSADTGER